MSSTLYRLDLRGIKIHKYLHRTSPLFNFSVYLLKCSGSHKRQFSSYQSFKKDCSSPLGKSHIASEVETGWSQWWDEQGFFRPNEQANCEATRFSILLPPPNVTGRLHLGHALTGAVQDAIVRWHRMKGHRTLWVPGTDHAGIATHAVVERKLWREQGKARHDIGRDAFVQEVWNWKQEHGDAITEQLKMMGFSLDWSRQYFTMDKNLSESVTEAFCCLFEKGLIYRDQRMINWSCALQSSLSDIEVDHVKLEEPTFLQMPGEEDKVEFGLLSSFAYPVENSDEMVVVSTTRLETMLGDTAVAVHPEDQRYHHLIGKRVIHPIDRHRLIPIIADKFVDRDFGTGAVKITPGHDATDHEVGKRHNLPILQILQDDGILSPELPLVGGQTRFVARTKLREALCFLGYYHGESAHPTTIPLCSRSGDVVEPRLKEQWFLDCKDMANRASQAVHSEKLKLIPEYNVKIWHEWLQNTCDWCLSRQLWWGHRIPVYTCQSTGRIVCARSEKDAKAKLAKEQGMDAQDICIKQDEDVLDTWFSSSLLPFSTMGWPHETSDMNKFFPQQLLETGQDILFFWVARMVMLSLELNDQLPFDKVLLHGMLRDAHGRKMSKSLGNVIDPVDVINGISLQDLHRRLETGNLDPVEFATAKDGLTKDFPNGIPACGSDALRFTLCSYNVKNMDINFDITHAESRKKFCNKIWQSFKFVLMKLGPDFKPWLSYETSDVEDGTDLWILSRLSNMVAACDQHFDSHDLHLVTSSLQQFWYQEFCDVYLEAVKPIFATQSTESDQCEVVRQILYLCTHTFLRAASPFMPFLCEELFQRLPPAEGELNVQSVCVAPYPSPEQFSWQNSELDESMNTVKQIAQHVLRIRREYNIMGSKSKVHIQTDDANLVQWITNHRTCLLALSRSSDFTVLSSSQSSPPACSSSVLENADASVFVELKDGSINFTQELERLRKRHEKLQTKHLSIGDQLGKLEVKGHGHITRANKLRDKLASIEQEQDRISDKINVLTSAAAQ